MSINLLVKLQERLGYPELKKIDPNTQELKSPGNIYNEQKMGQAVVSSVLAGIHQITKSEEGIHEVIGDSGIEDWLEIIFGDHAEEVVENVAAYASSSREDAHERLEEAAKMAGQIIKENTKPSAKFEDLKVFIANQRNNILPYLPAALHIGNLLDNPNMDDRTNKMKGPISNFMHMIEKGLGGHETRADLDEKKLNY